MKYQILQSLNESAEILNRFIEDKQNLTVIENCAKEIAAVFRKGNKVLICGNGGSACDAMHFAEEFTGRFRKERKALPVISLLDPSHITCVGNDYGFDYIFSRGVEAYGREGDLLIVLSTSGNSPNIIKAVKAAEDQKVKTLALLGKNGGELKNRCTHEFIIPGQTSDRIQEIHMMILHILIEMVERELFPELYS